MSSVVSQKPESNINYGAFSMLFLIASAVGFRYSILGILGGAASHLAKIWSQPVSGTQSIYDAPDITSMYLILLASCVGYILAIAFAGAGLATGKGNIFAGLTIGIALLPLLYAGYAIFSAGIA